MNEKLESLWGWLLKITPTIQLDSNKVHYMLGFIHSLNYVKHITDQEKKILIDKLTEFGNGN